MRLTVCNSKNSRKFVSDFIERNPVSSYRRYFDVLAEWTIRRLLILFFFVPEPVFEFVVNEGYRCLNVLKRSLFHSSSFGK